MKFSISRTTLCFAIIFVMLGINMLWTASLINPIAQIVENQRNLAKIAIGQNWRILNDTSQIIIILNTTGLS